MARSRDYLNNGGYENVDTSTSNNGAYSTHPTTHQMSSTPAVRTQNITQTSASKPDKYSFNGNVYSSYEAAQQAQKTHQQKVQATQAMNEADLASVNYDFNKYNTLKNSGQLLSQISDSEWQYITRLQKTDTSPTAYTKSVRDQYLYSLGLPSSKDLAQYRAKYVKYSSTGGILDVYKDLTEDEYNFIQNRFNEDTVAGFNGERVPKDTKNGKAIEYEDTLLDAQLKSAGLPSSELMNLYHAEYLRDKEIDADIEKFYSTVHSAIKLNKSGNESAIAELEKSDAYQKADTVTRQRMMSEAKASQSSSMDTFREVLERPEFSHLKDYYFESVQYPNRQDYITLDDFGRETFNEDKYNADLDKAVIKDTKRTDARHRVSYTDFEEYDSLATVNDIQEAEASSRTALRDTALGWFKKGATTEEEKKQRAKDINAFVRFGNNENNIKQAMQALAASEWYFEALDAGIPAEVAIKGKGAIASWNNDSNTSDVKKWTEVAMADYGYTKGDPPYDKIYDAVRRTRIEANATGFERNSVYDASLYNRQLLPDGSVTLYGAAYAEVNGIEHGVIQQSDDGEASHIFDYLFRTYDTEKGEARVKSLNDMERGVFNAIYRRNPEEALNYLMSLSDMLSDRSFDETYGSFDMGTVAEMSDDDYYGYMYDAYVYEENDKNSRYVEGTSNGWKRSAWENYKQYNDEEIDELIAESQATAARMQDEVASGEVSQEEAAAFFMSATEAQRDMRYVKEQRENARVNARNAVELRGYREEDGKKATEIVSANIEAYEQESPNVRLVNQAPTDNPYKTENAPTFSGGMNTSTIDLSGLKTYAEDEQMRIFAEMTPEQRDQFNWLLVNKGADSADAYIGSLREGLDIMAARRIQEKESAYATQGWNEVLTSFASIVGYPVTGMTSLIGTGLDYAAGIDVSRTQATQWDTTGVWREAISEEIGDQFGGLGSFVYDAVMSTCDSTVAMAVDTMLPFMGESFMAASAYASSLRQGLDEGLDSDHAVFSALVSAAIEFATEHAGLDAIGQNIATIGKKGVPWQQFVKGVLGSSVSEGSEELLSHVLDTAADALINGDKQTLIRNHDLLMEEKGFTDEEAWAQVWKDWAVEAGMSYAAGAFSGGLMTGVGGLGKAMRAGAVKLDSKLHEFAYGTPPVKPMTEQQVEAFNNGGEWLKSVIPGTAYTAITDMVNNNKVDTGKVDSLKQAITNRGNSGVQSYIDSMGLDVSNDNNLTALATSLAAMNCSTDIDSIDAAITRLMTADMSVQTKSDRNMASKDNIKSPEALGFLYETVQKFRQKIQDDQTTYNNWANPILTDLNDRALRIKSIQDSAAAEQDVGKKGALLKEASTLQAQYDKDYKKFKQQEKDQKRKLRDRLKDSETQIKTAQNSINKHFASLASFLSAYAPKSYDGGRSRRAQLDYREKKYGAELDKYMKSTTLSEKDKAAQITRVNNILDDTRAQRERLNQALSDEGNTLGKALQAARNGTVADFIQQYNEARASKTAETNSTVEDTTNPTSEQKTASEKVTDNLKTTNPVDVEISQKDQRSLTRSFARVGIELVWESRDKVGNGRANGFYNPDDHKIHLSTTMRTSKGDMPSLKIAQAVIVHEVTHFSAGTEGFIDLKNSAIDFLTNKYGAQWVDDVLNSIAEHYYEDYGQILSEPDVQEELTAYFVEDMLFNGQSGDEQALNRLTKKNRGLVSQILDYIQRMIARGTVRKMSNGDPVKLTLFDCETKLARALHERQYLDKIGKESAFEASDEQQNVEAEQPQAEQPQAETPAEESTEARYSSGGMSLEDFARAYSLRSDSAASYYDAGKLMDARYLKGKSNFNLAQDVFSAVDNAFADRGYNVFDYHVLNSLQHNLDAYSKLFRDRVDRQNIDRRERYALARASSFVDALKQISNTLSKPVLMSYDSFRFDRRFYMSSYLSAHNSMNIAKNRSSVLTDENLSDSDKKTLGRLWESVERQYAGMYNFLKSDFINVLNRYIDSDFIRKAQTSGVVTGSDEKRNRKNLYDTAKSSFFDETEYDSPAMQSKEIPSDRFIGFNENAKADSYTDASVPKEERVEQPQEQCYDSEREQIRREANEVRTRLANDLNNRTQFEWFGNVEDAPTVFRDSATHGRDFNSPDFIIPSYAQEGYDGMTSWEREQRDARLEDEHEERMNDARYSNDSDIRKMPGYNEAVSRYSNTLYQYNADEARNRVPEPRFVGTENDNRYSSGMSLQDYARAAREGDSQLLPGIENMSEELRQDIANTLEQTGGDLFDRAVEYGKAGTGFVYGRGEFGGSVSDIPYLFGRTEQSGAVSNGSQEGESSVRYAVPNADTGENIREAENVRYASHLTMGDLVGRYGGHKQNAFAKDNNIQIAKKRYKNLNYSQSMQTLSSVEYIQQSVRDFIAESATSSEFNRQNDSLLGTYRTKTLDAAEKYAENSITRKGGLSDALIEVTNELKGALDSRNASNLEHLMAKGSVIFRDIGAEGMETVDPYQFYDFLSSLTEYRSSWGRAGNLMKLVNKLPQARKMYWEKVVARMNKENLRRTSKGVNQLFYRDGVDEIKVPEPLYDALVAARNQTEINEAEYAITQYIGEHSPLTVSAALRNWRYFAMLANPVTHARNMMGNAGMLGGRMAKDAIAAGLENVAVKTGLMKQSDRTHSLTLTEESKDIAQQLWDEYRDIVQQDGHIGFRQNVREATKKSSSKLIDFLMRKNGNALESEDKLFLYATFMSAARQYITAQGITAKNMTKAQRNSIAAYATQQAQEATYRDAVKIADILHQVSQMNPVAEFMVDSIMPFKKTPINIARRGIEYSPVGLGIGLYHLAKDAVQNSKGKKMSVSAAKVCDELAKGLTGTALSMIGFFLSKAGILKISAGEGDRDEAFEKDVGHQDYSIEIGDLSIKIEQLAPLTFPLFMGASFEKLNSSDKDWFTLDDFGEALLTVADPLMDMSFLSGLNTALETYNDNSLSGVFGNMILSYGGQFLPTIGSKINNTTPFVGDTRMTAKSSAAAKSSKLDYQLRAWASKIPGLNKAVLEPYVSTTGEFQQKNNWQDWVLAHLNNFALPTNVQILDSSPVNEEIARLYSVTGTKDFIPENPKKYMRVNGKDYKMNAKEYTEFSKEHNEMVYTALSNVINSFDYQNSSDDHKAEMLEYAFDTAHKAVSEKYKYIFANKPQK